MGALEGKVAIVTGAGSGIGRAIARGFAAEGASVTIADINAATAGAVAEEIGDAALPIACDVSSPEQVEAMVAGSLERFGRIDILVNNAGVVYGTPINNIEPDEYNEILDVNLRGNFHMAQAVLPSMRQRGGGTIVCVSSIAGRAGGGVFGSSHYAAAKSGIFGLAKGLARELAPEGIRVNAVAPGPIDNEFTRGKMTAEDKARIAKAIPMGRLGTPDEVAKVILFLASDLSSYVTGVVLDVNGGLLIH